MRVLFLTTGPAENPGPRTRVFQYLPYFDADEIRYDVIEGGLRLPMQLANLRARWEREARVPAPVLRSTRVAELGAKALNEAVRRTRSTQALLMAFARGCDVVFAQAVVLPLPVVRFLQSTGRRVVYDMCDALYTRNGRFQEGERLAKILPELDLLIVASEETEAWIRARSQVRTIVVTGPIDTKLYRPRSRAETDRVTIGWVGSATTTHYLNRLGPVLDRLCTHYPHVVVKTIGAGKLPFSAQVRLQQVDWSMRTEAEELQSFDIGLMPLDDDEWSRGKGGYKLLQYMATGIPCVASPVGVNQSIVVEGLNGYLAGTDDEWFDRLSRLVTDAELRRRMGEAGRRLAVDEYSFDHYYPIVRDALAQPVAPRDTRVAEAGE